MHATAQMPSTHHVEVCMLLHMKGSHLAAEDQMPTSKLSRQNWMNSLQCGRLYTAGFHAHGAHAK